jgi:hypothetical protein
MDLIGQDQERDIEEDLLAFPLPDAVLEPVLLDIALIPLKARTPGKAIERLHRLSIHGIYTFVKGMCQRGDA